MIYFCFAAEMPMDLCMKKWFQPEFWSDPKLSIHAIHLKNEETTSTFATYWILKNHAYNQEIERAKRKIEKKIRRFFKEKTQLICLISIHIKRFCFFYCAMPEIAMMIVIFCLFVSWSHHLKNTAQILCVLSAQKEKENLNSGCFNKNC